MRVSRLTAALVILGAGVPLAPASATDGHFLHGVGAINSAMGGAGVAASTSVLGTVYLNPAGLMAFDGVRAEFGFELFRPERSVASDATGVGGGSGSTPSVSDFTPIPAFGASYKFDNERVVVALTGVGIGGFGVDYPSSQTNPVMAPPPNGFGHIYSNYQLLKITPAVAWAPSDNLWLGAGVNVDWASLGVIPAPFASPDVDQGGGVFYPHAGAADGAFGFGFQAGLQWHVNDVVALGASYTSEQFFQDFEFNSSVANPNLATYGNQRTLKFKLNVPAVASAGIGVNALPNLTLAGDFRYYFYESTAGFEIPSTGPFNPDGSVAGFGWENIYSIHAGVRWVPVPALSLMGGYNFSQNPIPDELSFVNIPAPAIVQHHATVGLGVRPNRHMEITLGYYRAFENCGTGPLYGPTGPVNGTGVTNTLSENSFLLQFSYATRGQL